LVQPGLTATEPGLFATEPLKEVGSLSLAFYSLLLNAN
jgi:hypothetical protein